ncbi:hypothetical protein SAMN05216198_0250 [Halopseudomonas litoralis]|uniref:DNA polymerase III subunit chi n=1 Tax=Halopseudomonas litoralis TaxID=797277 RepID=A0A1H1LGG9_9GAMM|nr:hypothetical protein [Halopseudomonas litoralis]SDR73638.1 hypothetical protein SAMN05216198_0250 [Halopseudomonas litoralis]
MTQREQTDPSRLLKDLESIRTLLDEPSATSQQPDTHLDIPLLQDIIGSGSDTLAPVASTNDDKTSNPFLPYESLARLAGERVQLERLLQQAVPRSLTGPHVGAREVRMEARLQAEAQLVMQDVIDEILPVIEAELRKRLSGQLDQIVQEQLTPSG